MRQRVALARALALEPDILLMDEPFGALDPKSRDALQAELVDIWSKTRKTIVFVTHDMAEAVRLGSRVIVLRARPARVARRRQRGVDAAAAAARRPAGSAWSWRRSSRASSTKRASTRRSMAMETDATNDPTAAAAGGGGAGRCCSSAGPASLGSVPGRSTCCPARAAVVRTLGHTLRDGELRARGRARRSIGSSSATRCRRRRASRSA